MPYDPNKHHRRSIRLKDRDYSQEGGYFVTICTEGRKWMFGKVENGEMHLNDNGQIVQSAWEELSVRFPHIKLDQYIIMPNHMHGIIINVGEQNTATNTTYKSPIKVAAKGSQETNTPTLGLILRTFKAVTTRHIRILGTSDFAWQRNYHEHIIRKNDDLDTIRQYIVNNPTCWAYDDLYNKEVSSL